LSEAIVTKTSTTGSRGSRTRSWPWRTRSHSGWWPPLFRGTRWTMRSRLPGSRPGGRDGKLPPHVMVYFAMAMALFADEDYEEVAASASPRRRPASVPPCSRRR